MVATAASKYGGSLKLDSDSQSLTLGEAASRFLASLPPEEGSRSQQDVYKFVRWYGSERLFVGLTAPEVANYAERLSSSDIDYAKKLELVRGFLICARKEGWTKTNLAAHLKTRVGKTRIQPLVGHNLLETISLTQEKFAELQTELAILKTKRSEAIDEIRKAAADKDFRENAPLEAAREQRGQLEGRIRELEQTLKSATIIGVRQEATLKAGIGNSVLLCDLVSNEELCYKIVSPREADPMGGKISTASPIGKAIIGRKQGDIVEVATPAGKLHYQIKRIER